MRADLIVIDGQNDFCDPSGALYVDGADKEAVLVSTMIKRLRDRRVSGGHRLAKIHASLDSHPRNDCSHNVTWIDQAGNVAPPFTIITHADVQAHRWRPRFAFGVWEGRQVPSLEWALKYTESLERDGRAPLCLWPPHCEIGKWGQNVFSVLAEAYDDWAEATGRWINFITKGHWPYTEHYSALRADVIDPTILATQLNVDVINDVDGADLVGWCGWAGSHCLRWTALDAVNHFGAGDNPFLRKSVFFEDASAAVRNPPGGPDFAAWRREFLDEVEKRGAKIMTTTEFLK